MTVSLINDAKTWETDVLQSPIPVFVDFWAEWCGPCRMVAPIVDELASEYEGKVKFVKVDVSVADGLARTYEVFNIPTLVIMKNGEIVSRQLGAASKESYQGMIDKALV